MEDLRRPIPARAVRVRLLLLALAAVTATGALAGTRTGTERSSRRGEPSVGRTLSGFQLKDTEGRNRSLSEFADHAALVLVFTGTQCPISNGYAAPLAKLAEKYRERKVQFLAVNSQQEDSFEQVVRHSREFRFPFPVLKDEAQVLAGRLDARVTPEAFVLDAGRVVRYRGRVDDSYESRTQKRARPANHDLELALDAVLAGKPVVRPVTVAFGCPINRPQKQSASPSGAKVTYYRQVAGILQDRCQSCHRPGQIAPFSLMTYSEARNWATEIKTFAAGRQMPPWKAEPGHGEFLDTRRLSDAEIATLAAWADAGAPAGDPKDAPRPKAWSSEWMLGPPDLVLKVTEPYAVSATGDDDFRGFVLPTNLTEDQQVVAVDIRPGNPKVVHHVLNFVDVMGRGRRLDTQDPGSGYATGPGGVGFLPNGTMGGWAPGNLPRFLPEGVGMPLPKGSDIVIQVHYHKTGKPETDQTQIGLYFAKKPIAKRLRVWPLTSFMINIPPGEARHEVKASMTLPADSHAVDITPHMHLLGREMKVTATFPDGRTESLIWIKDWDYRWQDTYRFKDQVALPKGTRVDLVAYFDNTSGNPRNPSNPPQRVRFGEATTDEMCFAFIGFTLDRE